MNSLDTLCLYSILRNNTNLEDLANMRLVCKKWDRVVPYVCRNELESLYIRETLEDAPIRVFQIAKTFRKVLMSKEIQHVDKVREAIPKLGSITQIKILKNILSEDELKQLINSAVDLFRNEENFPFLKTALVILTGDLLFAIQVNAQEAFLHMLNTTKFSQETIQKALYPACFTGNPSIVHTLVDLGANPSLNLTDQTDTYLTAACKMGCLKTVKLFINKGADPQGFNSCHEKPLAIAARMSAKMFEYILQLGNVDENLQETFGADRDKTLAHYAAEGNNSFVIAVLASSGLNPDVANMRGVTPLMITIREKARETFKNLLKCEILFSQRCSQGYTPLDYAIICGDIYYIEKLLKKIQDRSVLTSSLQTATMKGNVQAFSMILEALGVSTWAKILTTAAVSSIAGVFLYKRITEGE